MKQGSNITIRRIQNKSVERAWEKQKILVFCFFVFLLFILAFIYDPPKDLDRYENYYIGRSLVNMSIYELFSYYFSSGFDFIFYIGLGLFSSSMTQMQLFMGIITAFYYVEIFKYFNKTQGSLTANKILLLAGLLCFPSILYVVNLSRTVFAVAFFALGVNKYIQKKYIIHLLFFIVSFFTHAGIIIFITLFYVGLIAYFFLKNKPNLTRLLCVILPPTFYLLVRVVFLEVLQSALFIELFFDTKYDHYLDATGTATLKLSIGALFSIYAEIVLSYILVNIDKQVTLKKILFLVFTTITASILPVDQTLLNRFILVLPVFYSLYFIELYNKYYMNWKRNKIKLNWLTLSSIICMLSFALIIYQERKCFLPFLFG